MKEAVVYILDASPSMNLPYGDTKAKTTRLDCAKQALISMISDLMLQSITNEVCVICCKTAGTQHHMIAEGMDLEEEDPDSIPYPNLTELTRGVTRPTVELLRRIQAVETVTPEQAAHLRGDICDALVLAADALYVNTHKKKFQRKIVLLTDAEHDVVVDSNEYLHILDGLRNMDCRVEVSGMNFDPASTMYFKEQAPAPEHDSNKRIKLEDDVEPEDVKAEPYVEASARIKVEDDEPVDDEDQDDVKMQLNEGDDETIVLENKSDRERFLQDLTKKTGGQVVATSTLQDILDATKGKRVTKSTRRKIDFRIAPGLSFGARFMLLMKKEGYPKLDKEVVLVDDVTEKPILDESGKEMIDKVYTIRQYVDEENPEDIVAEEDITTAVRYGADLVPMNVYDFEGLNDATEAGPRLEILGYALRSQVPNIYLMGPPYALSGDESQKACGAISGLAKALKRLDKVAICTLIKTKQSPEYIVGALLPLAEPEYPEPIHLVFLQLPFAGDVKRLGLDSFNEVLEASNDKEKLSACDDLIDSLMLPESALQSGKIPSPFLRSWNQTKVKRALDPDAPIVSMRAEEDPMVTPPEVLARAKPVLCQFAASFPLQVQKTAAAKKAEGRKGRSIQTYKDFLE